MPGILKNKKILILVMLLFVIMFTTLWYLSFVILAIIVAYVLNKILLRYNSDVISILHQRREVVKIDTLVIGDTCTDKLISQYARGYTLRIQHPDCGLEATFQKFMHVESILEENGRLIIINDSKVDQQHFSIFDIPFINIISQKELGIEYLTKKISYPLIYETIRSLKILLRYKKTDYKIFECPKEELREFCKERGIDFIYLRK